MIKLKIKFLEDREVLNADGTVAQEFKSGEIYEVPAPSAQRWARRKVAEIVDIPKKRGRPKKVKPDAAGPEETPSTENVEPRETVEE